MLPKIHGLICRGARATHRTHTAQQEREAVKADNGLQPENLGNINTIEVMIFNPSGPYISGHCDRGSVTDSGSRQVSMVDYRRHTRINITVATAVQRTWACHIRTVLPADAHGWQRCNVVLAACSVVYLWYMSWAVCS